MLEWLVIGVGLATLGYWGYRTYNDPVYEETYVEFCGRVCGVFLGNLNEGMRNVKRKAEAKTQKETDENQEVA